mmetsp:Transcript_6466/g.20291  ORF Transcript_6466/g.20291 Transcript_6466/m.20291 type:complete len:310 (-) Transcript_6466:743-1672(-)
MTREPVDLPSDACSSMDFGTCGEFGGRDVLVLPSLLSPVDNPPMDPNLGVVGDPGVLSPPLFSPSLFPPPPGVVVPLTFFGVCGLESSFFGKGVKVAVHRSNNVGCASITCNKISEMISWKPNPPPQPNTLAKSFPVPNGKIATGGFLNAVDNPPPPPPKLLLLLLLLLLLVFEADASVFPFMLLWLLPPEAFITASLACAIFASKSSCAKSSKACKIHPTVPSPPHTKILTFGTLANNFNAGAGPVLCKSTTCSGFKFCRIASNRCLPVCPPDREFTNTSNGIASSGNKSTSTLKIGEYASWSSIKYC